MNKPNANHGQLNKHQTARTGATRAAISALAITSMTAIASDRAESPIQSVDWGSCPCVQTDAAWNARAGVNLNTLLMPVTLESVDQTQDPMYARSTNNIIQGNGGMDALMGEIDVSAGVETGTLYCSSYAFSGYEGVTSTHYSDDVPQAVSDCRAGLFKLVEQSNPLPPQS